MDGKTWGRGYPCSAPPDLETRAARWRLFRIVFVLTYLGIVLDVATTSLAYLVDGPEFEQNPLGSVLIAHLGWAWMFALLTFLCLVCYRSVRVVYYRLPLSWSRAIYTAVVVLTAFRWVAVVTSVLFLVHPPGSP